MVVFGNLAKAELPDYNSLKKEFVQWEGYNRSPYKLNGIFHVGIGHRIVKTSELNRSYTPDEIDALFKQDLDKATTAAKALFKTFDNQPTDIQVILVDMAFNLGQTGLSKFRNFREAIDFKNYLVAAIELENSLWYKQVGERSKHHVFILTLKLN